MATFNKKNMADIICNHKKTWCKKKQKYPIDFASTQLRIIRLHTYPIDPKAYLELWGVFLTKFHFYKKRSMEIPGKGLNHFYYQASFLKGYQANHRTNMFLSYKSNSPNESDHECICIVINGKICSVPLNILSSVVQYNKPLWLLSYPSV